MSHPVDILTQFFIKNNKESLLNPIIQKTNYLISNCTSEKDDIWCDFVKYLNEKIKDQKWKSDFFRKFYSSLRNFLKSSNPHFSYAMLDCTSSGDSSQGVSKRFRFQAKKGFFTYICRDFPLTKEDVLNAFLNNPKYGYKIEKAIACNEIAPETGEKHVHIYVQFYDKIDTRDALKYFEINSIHPNIKPDGNTSRAVSYCLKGGDYITHNMDPHYEVNTRKMHMQLLGYELIHKKMTITKAVEIYPELLFKYDNTKSNLNSYMYDKDLESNPGVPLTEWSMFGIQTWFSGKGKTPQYWIVGPSNVGKTYNIEILENAGHRSYLMSKENDWSDYCDQDYDFMYNEETGADFKLTFLNQLLEGTRIKLNGKYVKSVIKKKNMPIIMNSNYMPHMLYKNTSLYDLEPTLNRMYIIYVDTNRQGHIVWNPNTMNINEYIDKFVNNEPKLEDYEGLFGDKYQNESYTDKSYIKYTRSFDIKDENENKGNKFDEKVDNILELANADNMLENWNTKNKPGSMDFKSNNNYADNSDSNSVNDTSSNYIYKNDKIDLKPWEDVYNQLSFNDPGSESDSVENENKMKTPLNNKNTQDRVCTTNVMEEKVIEDVIDDTDKIIYDDEMLFHSQITPYHYINDFNNKVKKPKKKKKTRRIRVYKDQHDNKHKGPEFMIDEVKEWDISGTVQEIMGDKYIGHNIMWSDPNYKSVDSNKKVRRFMIDMFELDKIEKETQQDNKPYVYTLNGYTKDDIKNVGREQILWGLKENN